MQASKESASAVSNTFSANFVRDDLIPLFQQSGEFEGRSIIKTMKLIVGKKITINAVDEVYNTGLLTLAVTNIKETSKFVHFLDFFIGQGGDINLVNKHTGHTVLDVCDDLKTIVPDYSDRRELLVKKGGKLGREVSDVARLKAAEPIIPGYSGPSASAGAGTATFSAFCGFSYEDKTLRTVSEFLDAPEDNSEYLSSISITEVIKKVQPAIGRLFDVEDFVSTLFLINDDWVITARHSVNYSKLENLTVMFGDDDFDESKAIPVAGVIEDGADIEMDYIILKLSKPVPEVAPLQLTCDNTSTSLLFIGYNTEAILRFSALPNENLGQLKIVGYQGTGARFSGSPYIGLDGRACGLHSGASTDYKTGIYINTIIVTYSDSVLGKLINNKDLTEVPLMVPVAYLPEFSTAIINEFDERDPLKIIFDNSTGSAVFRATGGPNNQSAKKVQDRITVRINRLQEAGKILTNVQTRFLTINYKLKLNNIDIAHNIAISAVRDALIKKMNTPIPPATRVAGVAAERVETAAFADAIASSDDENPAKPRRPKIKEKLRNFVHKIRTEQSKVGGITAEDANDLKADALVLLKLINQRSKNLMPGHAKVNQQLVGDHRDPHLIKKVDGGYEETAISRCLAETATAFFGSPYSPKAGAGSEKASSSVDSGNDPALAYYTP